MSKFIPHRSCVNYFTLYGWHWNLVPSYPFLQLQTKLPWVLKQSAIGSHGLLAHSFMSMHFSFINSNHLHRTSCIESGQFFKISKNFRHSDETQAGIQPKRWHWLAKAIRVISSKKLALIIEWFFFTALSSINNKFYKGKYKFIMNIWYGKEPTKWKLSEEFLNTITERRLKSSVFETSL